MFDVKAAATKKIGPLPAWGWAVAIGGGIFLWRALRGGTSSEQPFPGGDENVPTGVNPIAGLPSVSDIPLLPSIPVPGTIGGGTEGQVPNPVGGNGSGVVSSNGALRQAYDILTPQQVGKLIGGDDASDAEVFKSLTAEQKANLMQVGQS